MCADFAHVCESLRIRPMFCEYGETIRILLDLPRRLTDTRPLETEFQSADAGEQRTNPHVAPLRSSSASAVATTGVNDAHGHRFSA